MDLKEKALALHKQWNGKLSTEAKSPVKSREDLSIAYTPGVAEPCKVIAEDPSAAYTYTMKANTVAVISDGSAVLGLGNIGALAAMPVMKMRTLQRIRRCQCNSYRTGHTGHRRNYPHSCKYRTYLWRHQPGRYLCTEMF